VLAKVRAASNEVEAIVASLDVEGLDGTVATEYVEVFAQLERLAAAGKALAARRVVATRAWRHADGAPRDEAGWLASLSGSTVGQAAAVLESVARLGDLPATEAAFRAGDLSPTQVSMVAAAATADASAEAGLLDRATVDGIKGLREHCTRVKAAARIDEVAHHTRIRAERSLRHWTDDDGAGRISIRGPVDDTAVLMAALEPYERELFDAARARGERERADAIAFDAMVELAARTGRAGRAHANRASDNGSTSRPTALVQVRVDHAALRRGHTEPGEVCEIVGSGPIPVEVASRLLDDAIVHALAIDGTDVTAVSHLGRLIPARLRSALLERQRECAIEGCHVDRHLEIDHNLPVEAGGPTTIWNLNRLCSHHHRHKHHHDLRLVGAGVDLQFVPASEWSPPPGHGPP